MKKVSKILEKKAQLDILERLFNELDSMEKDVLFTYKIVGYETEQATDWRTGELRWKDDAHTEPYYKPKYDYVPKTEFDDEDKAKDQALSTIRTMLEKLI